MARLLVQQGFNVSTCFDGTTARTTLERERFDVLVTDIHMPGLDGLALCRWCREQRHPLLIVVITGHGSDEVRDRVFACGADVYLEKISAALELVEVLRSLVEIG